MALVEPRPWLDGFEIIDRVLAGEGRPAQALCAIELRCPAPHSFDGFGSFNDDYRQALDRRSILLADGTNPVARTNVAPTSPTAGDQTELHAFSYTVARGDAGPEGGGRGGSRPGDAAGDGARPSFVIAGAGDLADQADLRPEAIVGGATPWADSGPARASAVLAEMEARLAALDLTWADTDAVVAYSVEHIGAVLDSTVLPRLGIAGRNGILWHHARPPVEGLRFEMDTRGGTIERHV